MDNRKLPGLNYGSGPGLDDFEFLEDVLAEEIRFRTKLFLGHYRNLGSSYGIVSENDPREAAPFTSSPLLVKRNTQQPLRFDVKQGFAVTQAGDFVRVRQDQAQLSPADTTSTGDQYVVFLEYQTSDDEDTNKVNRYNNVVARRRTRDEDGNAIKTTRLNIWNDITQFPPERKKHIVALALITIVEEDGNNRLNVSLDNNQLSENRPWFSPVDIEHRQLRGTGSEDVPHALSLSDLSSGDLTLYKQKLSHGVILSRDEFFPHVPGTLCVETVDAIREKVDVDGSITGTMGVKYYELQRFPTRLLGVADVNNPDREIPAYIIPHTNLLAIHGDESVGAGGSRVYYTTTSSGEPPLRSEAHDELFFRQPNSDNEIVIAGGKAFTELQPSLTNAFGEPRSKISMGESGPIPKSFNIFVDSDGHLISTPQILLCGKEIEDLGTASFDVQKEMFGSANVRIGLTDTSVLPSMDLTVEVIGDTEAGSVVEELTFTENNYEPGNTGDCFESNGNFVVSDNIFTSVSSIRIKTKTNIDPNARIMVYADLDPLVTTELRDACPLAHIIWNGQSVCRIFDTRRVGTSIDMPSRTGIVKAIGQSILASSTLKETEKGREIASDDFRDPHFVSVTQGIKHSRLSDGLRSTLGANSPDKNAEQDTIYTQAFMLPDQNNRTVQVVLFGRDVKGTFFQAGDGIRPIVEYRVGKKQANPWGSWSEMDPAPQDDKISFFADIPDGFDDNFKIQFRIKGSVIGYTALVKVPSDLSHSGLVGLENDDHIQYLLVDGTRQMDGSLDMGQNNIEGVSNVDGRDVSDDGSTLDSHVADTDNPHVVTPSQVGNDTAQWNANKIIGRDVHNDTPSDGDVLIWNSSEERWEPSTFNDLDVGGDLDVAGDTTLNSLYHGDRILNIHCIPGSGAWDEEANGIYVHQSSVSGSTTYRISAHMNRGDRIKQIRFRVQPGGTDATVFCEYEIYQDETQTFQEGETSSEGTSPEWVTIDNINATILEGMSLLLYVVASGSVEEERRFYMAEITYDHPSTP